MKPNPLSNNSVHTLAILPTLRFGLILSGILLTAANLQAQGTPFITTDPSLPPIGGAYQAASPPIYGAPALQFTLNQLIHRPTALQSRTADGQDELETFDATLDGTVDVTMNGVPTAVGLLFTFSGYVTTRTFDKIGNVTGTFDTEMLTMNLSGVIPLPLMIRESPTRLSLGQTTITDIGGGQYRIDSFFDVFTELSIDGGATWMPNSGGATRLTLGANPAPSLSATLSGGNLTILDTVGRPNTWTVARSGANLVITDLNETFQSAPAGGMLSDGDRTLTIPLASVTGFLELSGGTDDDQLTVNLGGGNAIPPGGLNFNGQAGSDRLTVTGGATTTITHTFANANDGSVALAGALAGTITYTGLEPVTDNVSATDRIFTFNGGAETITLTDAAGPNMTIDSTLGESVTFANPSSSLTINAGTGNDLVTITSVDGAFNASLIINGDAGDDTVSLNGDITFATDASLDVDLQNDSATPGVDTVNVGANANLITSGAGTITVKCSRNVLMNPGSSFVTADGNIVVEANQQPVATAGNFKGIWLNGATVQSSGTGGMQMKGKAGSDAPTGDHIGLLAESASAIMATGAGFIVLEGTGGNGGAGDTYDNGIHLADANTKITTASGGITMTGVAGTGGGSDRGIEIFRGALVSAGGSGSIVLNGTGGGAGDYSEGVTIWYDTLPNIATVQSSAGDITINGTAGVAASGVVLTDNGLVTTADGLITINGIIGTGTGIADILMIADVTGSGRVAVTGTGAAKFVANSMFFDGSAVINAGANPVTLVPRTSGVAIDLGGNDVLGGTPTLGLTDAELDRITAGTLIIGDANSGPITVSLPLSPAGVGALSLVTPGVIADSFTVGIDVTVPGLTTSGNLSPGASPGVFSVAGNHTIAAGSTFTVEFGGATPGDGPGFHDQLSASGTVHIGSGVTLSAVAAGIFVPSPGQRFVIIARTGGSGMFDSLPEGAVVSANFLGSGVEARITYAGGDGNDVAIVAACVTAGDVNGDGQTDLVDYNILRSDFGSAGSGLPGDLNEDERVDLSDYLILRNDFGNTAASCHGPWVPPAGAPAGNLCLRFQHDGRAELHNSAGGAISFDSYQIYSAASALSVGGWSSISDQVGLNPSLVTAALGAGALSFSEAGPTASLLSELNLVNSGTLSGGGTFGLGSPYGGNLANVSSDVRFFYTEAGVLKEGCVRVLAVPEGMALWLKADAGVTTSGSQVTHWADQSGNLRDASQAVMVSQPLLAANVVNGRPAVCFDGVTNSMAFNLPVNGVSQMSLFLVAANTLNQNGGSAQAEQAALFWNETQFWGTVYLSPYQSTVNFRFGTTQSGNRIIYQRPVPVGNKFTLSTAVKSNTVDSLYVNRALVLTQNGKQPAIAGCQDIGQLGRGYNDNTFYAGYIAEVLVYTNALSETERQSVEAYLDAKYNLTAPVPPQITQQPMPVSVEQPLPASFNVGASGTLPLSYQWRTNGVPIGGANNSSYNISPTSRASHHGLMFDVVVTNIAGAVTSAVANLTVTLPASAAPVIQTPPASLTVIAPNAATFSVVVNGSAPLHYQWRSNGVDIAGATASIYTLNPTDQGLDHGKQFTVVITNVSGSVTSAPATLTLLGGAPTDGLALWLKGDGVTGVPDGSPLSQWNDQSGNNRHATQGTPGSQPLFRANQLNGQPVVRFDGVNHFLTFNLPVNGLGGMSLILVAANNPAQVPGPSQAERAALFWNETAAWGTVYLTPFQNTVAMRFGTLQANNRILHNRASPVGSAFTLTTAIKNGATGTDTLFINRTLAVSQTGKQPTINGCSTVGNVGRGYNDNTHYAGDIAEVLVYTKALTEGERQAVEQYLDSKYALTTPAAPQITQQPANALVVAPQPATFTVVANGSGPLSYQWRRSGVNIPGASGSSYVLSPTTLGDDGAQFDVVVSNPSLSVTSTVAQLTVLARPPETDLALWLKADEGPVLSGSAVTQWTDQSGQGHHAGQLTSARQPRLDPNALNGFPVVRFDGVDDYLTFDLPVNDLTGLSLFLVAANTQNQDGGGTQAERAALFWNESAYWGTVYLSPFQGSVKARFGTGQAGNRMQYNRPSSAGSAFTLSSAIKNGATDSLYVNRTLQISQGGKLSPIANCQDTGNLGRGYDDNSYFVGGIAEVLVYTRAVSEAERVAIEGYLNGKYALGLPAGGGGGGGGSVPGLKLELATDSETPEIFRVTLSDQPGKSYHLEHSSDLREWTPVETITLPVSGPGRWIQLVPVEARSGFFRARSD